MFAVFGALCAIYIICVRHGVADALFSGCAAAWFFRLRRFSAVSATFLAAGLFRPCFRLFRPLCCVLSLRADAAAAYAVLAFCRQIFLPKSWPHSSAADCCRCKGLFSWLSERPSFGSQKVVFCSPKGYLSHAERPPFRKWLFGASDIASRQPSGQGRAVPRQGHPEGIIRGVRRSEILLLFIVRNIKFCLKVNLCPDFVSYYLSVGSNVFA